MRMRMMGIAAAALCCSSVAATGQAKPAARAEMRLAASLADKRVSESSGLAASRKNPGLLWTHNDSGSGPYVFATDAKGRSIARVKVTGAGSVDWEDMAVGINSEGVPCLFIADIGDNGGKRRDACVYEVPEPAVDMSVTGQELETMLARKYPFQYPDGAHDAETLLVHPTSGEMLIVTKRDGGDSGVYRFPRPLEHNTKVALERVGSVAFTNGLRFGGRAVGKLATGGAVSSDGKRVAIRTYTDAFEWSIGERVSVAEALKGDPKKLVAPWLGQFEAICYTLDGKKVLTTSEGAPCALWEVGR